MDITAVDRITAILIALVIAIQLYMIHNKQEVILNLIQEDMYSFCINNQIEEEIYDVQD